MKVVFMISFFLQATLVTGQQVVFDARKVQALINNHAVTWAQLNGMVNSTETRRAFKDEVNSDLNKLLLIRQKIYNAHRNVSSLIRDGKNVAEMGNIVSEIMDDQKEMVGMVRNSPQLLAVALKTQAKLISRTVDLGTHVVNATTGGKDNLINERQRIELIRYVIRELRALRWLVFHVNRRMRLAARIGVIDLINPFNIRDYQRDAEIVRELLTK
jgi:hypothetical protein